MIPDLALSVRQPWAWALIYGGKDVENRTPRALSFMNYCNALDRLTIHASKGMTKEEYDDAAEFMAKIGVVCPPPDELKRGGIIGHVKVLGTVQRSKSPWFFGPRAIVVADPLPCDFVAAVGRLGLFAWEPSGAGPDPVKPWMLKRRGDPKPLPPAFKTLFDS